MSAALLTGCKNDDSGTTEQPTDAPEIEVGAQTPQTIPAEGGTVTLAYEIVNPVQGGLLSATSAEEWIHDFDCDQAGQLTFTADANESDQSRSRVRATTEFPKEVMPSTSRTATTSRWDSSPREA